LNTFYKGIFLHKLTTKSFLKKNKPKITLIASILFLTLLVNLYVFNISNQSSIYSNINGENFDGYNQNLEISNGQSLLFQGIESSLNINDTGNLYELNQEITISNEEELNLSYYLDAVNDWKVSKIETSINNLQDTRNWINNSEFQPVQVYREYQIFESAHNYDNVRTAYLNEEHTIQESNAIYMRVHFVNISFDYQNDDTDSDFMYVYNGSWYEHFVASGYREDFYSPWVNGEIIYLSYQSNNPGPTDYGYYIDYYEFVNTSSNLELNTDDWSFDFEQNGDWGSNSYGAAQIKGNDAMFVGYHGDYWDHDSFVFYENTFSEIYQDDIEIPRGKVIDAYLSFDYYVQFGLEVNNIFMYMEINNERVYSKGMLDLDIEGKNIWHHTNKVPMYLWINQSRIFNTKYAEDQILNVSVGIKHGGAPTIYSGYDDGNANVVWFDNITFAVTTMANSSQDGINLKINTFNLIENNEWGKASLNLTDGWDTNPIILTVSTTSPVLNFDLNTTLYGYHESLSSYNQLHDQGVSYELLENGTIYWEIYHYLYMPPTYEDFEFKIEKPIEWEFISVLDPFLQTRYFEYGKMGDDIILINKSNAIFAGWYTLRATSPNYLNISNTKIRTQGQWSQNATFTTGESTQITTQLNYNNEIPTDVSNINLTIYYPNGTIFYEESKFPVNGNATFSNIYFGISNTSGGLYEYTLFWSNGTALGGLRSSFIVVHDSYLTILKPDDAKVDNITGATVGDIIPVRIYLRDAENNLYISNSLISYNWTSGTRYFAEAALGIYEAILDTSDLGGYGLYNIVINSSKLGFINCNLTLMINLGENTNLQRLDSDSKIVIHDNSTIRFFYYSEFDEEGIPDAQVLVNISNPNYYTIRDLSEGIYSIEFSTEFINNTGVYRLIFEFTLIGYEPQIHIYQFEITDPPIIPEGPNLWLWAILFASIGFGTVFAALSLRSYVILPRKRKKEADLLAKTQGFKDLKNIQAIVIIHKLSGIPIYSKSYSILEKHKKELFSGFIQAITMIGEEFAEKEITESEKSFGVEKLMELDFKQFYCLIADIEEIRTVFILKEKSSEKLKNQISHLILALNLKLSKELEDWDGALDDFEILVPQIINEYFDLYYKESFTLTADINLIKMKKEKKLTKMDLRIINVIQSMSKDNKIPDINNIVELVHEENKDLIIKAIESLIKQKIIIPLRD